MNPFVKTNGSKTSPMLTTEQCAERLGCSSDSVLRAIKRGDLPAMRYGRLVRVSEPDLTAFIHRHTTRGR